MEHEVRVLVYENIQETETGRGPDGTAWRIFTQGSSCRWCTHVPLFRSFRTAGPLEERTRSTG